MAEPFKSWNSFGVFERTVRHQYRFLHDKTVREFLEAISVTVEERCKIIPTDKALWRARIGYDVRDHHQDGQVYEEPIARGAADMKPRKYGASEGRANPRGIPYLYTASTPDTAIAEVRPLLDDLVSVAQLVLKRDLRIVDCCAGQEGNFEFFAEEPEPREREEAVWRAIGRAYSRPVSPGSDYAEYVPTQVLAEHFRQLEYDGIGYKSKLGDGFNIAVFDMDLLDVLDCKLHLVTHIRYSSREF